MKIDEVFIGEKKPYIIAEVSQNHDGSLGQAHAFIDAVAKTGADAIKFQTHIAEEESTPKEPFRVNFSYCDKTRYDYWKRMEFTEEQWKGLYRHAQESGLDFLSSPFSVAALEMLDRIGVPAWKLGSGEVFNSVLLKRVVYTGKPIILSTGLSTIKDIDEQVKFIKEKGNSFLLMECTSEYPSSPETIPLQMLEVYRKRYQCRVGLSDHSATIFPSLAAMTLGACAIEVHVTMSREMFGPDVKASVTMEELATIVRGANYIFSMLNSKETKESLDSKKEELKRIFSKSIYVKKDLKEGDILTEDMIAIKKPYDFRAVQVADYEAVLGKKITKDIAKDAIITWENIEK